MQIRNPPKSKTTKWKSRITKWKSRTTKWKSKTTKWKSKTTKWKCRTTKWKSRITKWLIELGLLSHRHISGHLGTHRIEDFVSRSHLQWKKYETLKQNLHTCWKIELQMFHLFNPFPVASYDILGSSSGIIL